MVLGSRRLNILDPLVPMMDLLEPTLTVAAPVMVPLIKTMPAESPAAADVRAASVVTVVTLPPFPPLVPPFRVAYPTSATSDVEALFTSGEA